MVLSIDAVAIKGRLNRRKKRKVRCCIGVKGNIRITESYRFHRPLVAPQIRQHLLTKSYQWQVYNTDNIVTFAVAYEDSLAVLSCDPVSTIGFSLCMAIQIIPSSWKPNPYTHRTSPTTVTDHKAAQLDFPFPLALKKQYPV